MWNPSRLLLAFASWLLLLGNSGAEERPSPLPYQPTSAELKQDLDSARQLWRQRAGGVLNERLAVHWLPGGRLWYRRQTSIGHEFILVECATGEKRPAFDANRLASSLGKVAKEPVNAKRLPFEFIDLPEDGKSVRFNAFKQGWVCTLDNYEVKTGELLPTPTAPVPPQRRPAPRFWTGSATSPDGKWKAFIREQNLHLQPADGRDSTPLTSDGKAGAAYSQLSWAPDSQAIVVLKRHAGEGKQINLVEFFPKGTVLGQITKRTYDQPGDKMPRSEIMVVPLGDKKPRPVEGIEPAELGFLQPRWRKDGRHFLYEQTERGHQRHRLVEVDSQTGKTRFLVDEQTKTFIHGEAQYSHFVGDEALIRTSEKSGWNHLYWVDLKSGEERPITSGQWRIRRVLHPDDDKKQLWFTASGMDAGQDPYFIHYFKVNYDGTNLVRLTEGPGTHGDQFSPDGEYFVDSYSRVDSPPVHELRRTRDGKLVTTLEIANIDKLKANSWKPPQVFTAKGRDGKTDIWGLVFWPPRMESGKKYPVIEHIYAGPQGSFVPKSFAASHGELERLAHLGFIVVKIDGMGTANRSKAFHDMCWKNLADAGLPDRIAWMKALAAKHPQVDLERVGICGGSAGGQNSTGALLFHPEFYKVAVSSCGCHDNRIDKRWWNEQWMGYPVGPHYEAQSNITNAGKLQGRLLLIVGEKDTNVPPESTYRLAEALWRAKKEFELVVIPGGGHGDGGEYGERKRRDFFIRYLMNVEPPNPNGGS